MWARGMRDGATPRTGTMIASILERLQDIDGLKLYNEDELPC